MGSLLQRSGISCRSQGTLKPSRQRTARPQAQPMHNSDSSRSDQVPSKTFLASYLKGAAAAACTAAVLAICPANTAQAEPAELSTSAADAVANASAQKAAAAADGSMRSAAAAAEALDVAVQAVDKASSAALSPISAPSSERMADPVLGIAEADTGSTVDETAAPAPQTVSDIEPESQPEEVLTEAESPTDTATVQEASSSAPDAPSDLPEQLEAAPDSTEPAQIEASTPDPLDPTPAEPSAEAIPTVKADDPAPAPKKLEVSSPEASTEASESPAEESKPTEPVEVADSAKEPVAVPAAETPAEEATAAPEPPLVQEAVQEVVQEAVQEVVLEAVQEAVQEAVPVPAPAESLFEGIFGKLKASLKAGKQAAVSAANEATGAAKKAVVAVDTLVTPPAFAGEAVGIAGQEVDYGLSEPRPSSPIVTVLFTTALAALTVVTGGIAYLALAQWLDSQKESSDLKNFESRPRKADVAPRVSKKGSVPKKATAKGFGN